MANVTDKLFSQYGGLLGIGDVTSPVATGAENMLFNNINTLGAGVSSGIRQAFGQQSPQEQLKAIAQQIQKEGIDPGTPEGMVEFAKRINEANPALSGIAMSIRQQAAKQAEESAYKQSMIKKNLSAGSGGSSANVQSSKQLPDGTTVMVLRNGTTRVVDAGGNEITDPTERADIIKAANKYGVNVATETAYGKTAGELTATANLGAQATGAKAAGEQGVKLSGDAYKAFNNLTVQIGNLDNAIDALTKGAKSGVIYKRLPTWDTATLELRNAANNLGLDVVSSVTFGALSEGELTLAMSTAVPMDMNEKDLKDYLIRKKAAQTKLKDYMKAQAEFLATPGNTLAMWLSKAGGANRPSGALGVSGGKGGVTVGRDASGKLIIQR